MKSMWKNEWPTEPGSYWFYGWPYGIGQFKKETPELNYVEVRKVTNGMMVVNSGAFWYKSEGWIGMFSKVDIPEFPDLSEIFGG